MKKPKNAKKHKCPYRDVCENFTPDIYDNQNKGYCYVESYINIAGCWKCEFLRISEEKK